MRTVGHRLAGRHDRQVGMHDGQADGKTERCVEKRLISPSKRLEAALPAVKGEHFYYLAI